MDYSIQNWTVFSKYTERLKACPDMKNVCHLNETFQEINTEMEQQQQQQQKKKPTP